MTTERARVEELLTDDELRERHLKAPGVKERIEEAVRIAKEARDDDAGTEEGDLLNLPRERG